MCQNLIPSVVPLPNWVPLRPRFAPSLPRYIKLRKWAQKLRTQFVVPHSCSNTGSVEKMGVEGKEVVLRGSSKNYCPKLSNFRQTPGQVVVVTPLTPAKVDRRWLHTVRLGLAKKGRKGRFLSTFTGKGIDKGIHAWICKKKIRVLELYIYI